MFTVGVFVIAFHMMLCSVLDVVSTFISDNIIVNILPIILFSIMFGVGILDFINTLFYSYKIEENKIIKGRIVNVDKINGSSLMVDAAATLHMLKNIGDSSKVLSGSNLMNFNKIIRLIELNLKQEFVETFFDSDVYKRKVYDNPILVKETKYSLVYRCDKNKKLVIPKIYEGMDIKNIKSTEKSLILRIIEKSLVVFIIFFALSIIDLTIGIKNNSKYLSNINSTCSNIQENLNGFGYNLTDKCNFKKVISKDRTSTVNYRIDKNGKIEKVSIELYYDYSNYSDEELRYIINSLNTNFTNEEIDGFINRVNSCVNNVCLYGKIQNENTTLRIGKSSNYINIHNY